MLRRIRKSSGHVTLVLIGVAALAGCSDERRDVYASREDCLADWGNKPEDCTAATDGRRNGAGGAYYFGPSYRVPWWRGSNPYPSGTTSRSVSSVSSSHVARGGFGSTARGGAGGGG